jgi:hypothetical protein
MGKKSNSHYRSGFLFCIASMVLSARVLAAGWQTVSDLETLEAWQFNSNTTMVELVEDPENPSRKVVQIKVRADEPDAKDHAVASATSSLFTEGGTLFFRMRMPAEDLSPINGRICFAPERLTPGNQSCGFKFLGGDRIAVSPLTVTEPTKPAWVQSERWYHVWLHLDARQQRMVATLRCEEIGQNWEFSSRIKLPDSSDVNAFAYFGAVIGRSHTGRPLQLADFHWVDGVSTEVPAGVPAN